MKKTPLLVTSILSIVFMTGCTSPTPTTPSTPVVSEKTTGNQNIGMAINEPAPADTQQTSSQQQLTATDYKQWMLSPEIIKNNIFDWQNWGKEDCYGLMNGMNDGGDLLSTLIADDETRAQLELKTYTPEYVLMLEKKIVAETHDKYASDFYAISVCHLGNGIDVVAGSLWPEGKPTLTGAYFDAHYKTEKIDHQQAVPALIVSSDHGVHIYKDIQLMNNTATGAETYPCDAELDENNLLWTCFQRLHSVDENTVSGSELKEWNIPLDGGTVKTREYVETAE